MNSHLIFSGMSFFSFAAWELRASLNAKVVAKHKKPPTFPEPEAVICMYIYIYLICIYIYMV